MVAKSIGAAKIVVEGKGKIRDASGTKKFFYAEMKIMNTLIINNCVVVIQIPRDVEAVRIEQTRCCCKNEYYVPMAQFEGFSHCLCGVVVDSLGSRHLLILCSHCAVSG